MLVRTLIIFIILATISLAVAVHKRKEAFLEAAICEPTGPCEVPEVTNDPKIQGHPYFPVLTQNYKNDPNNAKLCIKVNECYIKKEDREGLSVSSCQQLGSIMQPGNNGDCIVNLNPTPTVSASTLRTRLSRSLDVMQASDNKVLNDDIKRLDSEIKVQQSTINENKRQINDQRIDISRRKREQEQLDTDFTSLNNTINNFKSEKDRVDIEYQRQQARNVAYTPIASSAFSTPSVRCGITINTNIRIIQKQFRNFRADIPALNGYYTLLYKYCCASNQDPYRLWVDTSSNIDMVPSQFFVNDINYRNRHLINHVFGDRADYYIIVEIYNNDVPKGMLVFKKTSGDSIETWFTASKLIASGNTPFIGTNNYNLFSLAGDGVNRWLIASTTSSRNTLSCESKVAMFIPSGNTSALSCKQIIPTNPRYILLSNDQPKNFDTLDKMTRGNIMYVYVKKIVDDIYQDEANITKTC